ncbi:MAG: DUF4442 domain-containing protein [Crocinitomicaceae bacterium]|nr:DUF4442 domain-containing protein [Crocinitomicaceae bacterium]MBK8926071.1 DUF4442 domain-containing protein [Crocinitomicaceae bacterium]
MKFQNLIKKAATSKFALFKLNWLLALMVPFNKPHRIKIASIGDDFVSVRIPHRKKNFNHIKGIHACGLATAAEFASGFHLLRSLDHNKYRIIMKSLHVDYFFQAKMDALASFRADEKWIHDHILEPLVSESSKTITAVVELHDTKGNHLATAQVEWQVKAWEHVKTKL